MDDSASVILAHRKLAREGGRARANALSREQRAKIARMGGRAGGRGRRKDDRIPPDLAKKIGDLIGRTVAALWYMPDSMKPPRFRGPARFVLKAIARNGHLDAYKSAHQLLKCL